MKSNMKSITVAKYIFNKLYQNNIKYVFGYSGGALLPLLDQFYKSKDIEFIKNSTEQCSGYMAEGYSKSLYSSQPGIIISTSGPGLTNIITPLQNAFSDGTPLIAISGQVPTNAIGTDAFQECDAVNLTKHCTKWNYRLKHKDEIKDVLDKAFKISMEPRKGPVHIDIPKDLLLENVNYYNNICYGKDEIYHNKNIDFGVYNKNNINYDYLIDKLKTCEKPVIIAGQGCNTTSKELSEFAFKNNIPVTTTLHGMGCFNEEHDLSLEMLGMHGNPVANYAIQESDLIIAIGTRFDDRTTGNIMYYGKKAIEAGLKKEGGIIHIDSSIKQIVKVRKLFEKHYRVKDNEKFLKSINTDTYSLFKTLCSYEYKSTDKKEWVMELNNYRKKNAYYYNEDKNLMKTPDVIKSIDKQLKNLNISKKNVIFTTGVGNHQMWTSQHIKWTEPGKMITSGSLGTMGVGVPFAIGSKLANPDKMVICIDGDSSFTMTSNELQTLLEYDIPVKIAIMNDGRQQMVHTWQKLFHNERFIGTTNKNPNFEYLGKAYNIKTITCSNKKTLNRKVKEFLLYDKSIIGIFNVEPEMCFPLVAPGKALDEMIMNESQIENLDKNINAPN
jgi:acetolactate synthase I/II/III large subunit